MSFRSLAESLRDTAQAVSIYLRQQLGLRSIKVEEEVAPGLPKPTLHAATKDGEIICVEFSEKDFYPTSLARFVEDYRDQQWPLKVYIAVPSTSQNGGSMSEIVRARKQGIGVMLVDPSGNVNILHEPISLLVSQLRHLEMKNYPPKMRVALSQAQQTFLNGNPPKGCSELYELIEDVSRKIVKSAALQGCWSGSPPAMNWDSDPWFNVCTTAHTNMRFASVGTLSSQLWANVLGITRHRNETAHKPKTVAKRKARDLEMRTRFEHAGDLLKDILQSTKGFRY